MLQIKFLLLIRRLGHTDPPLSQTVRNKKLSWGRYNKKRAYIENNILCASTQNSFMLFQYRVADHKTKR